MSNVVTGNRTHAFVGNARIDLINSSIKEEGNEIDSTDSSTAPYSTFIVGNKFLSGMLEGWWNGIIPRKGDYQPFQIYNFANAIPFQFIGIIGDVEWSFDGNSLLKLTLNFKSHGAYTIP